MNVAPHSSLVAAPHKVIAQQSYDQFAAAWDATSQVDAGTPGALDTALQHVTEGVALLGRAYAAIPQGAYHPGNEALTTSWAATAVAELRAGSTSQARSTLDEILERVANDFDLG